MPANRVSGARPARSVVVTSVDRCLRVTATFDKNTDRQPEWLSAQRLDDVVGLRGGFTRGGHLELHRVHWRIDLRCSNDGAVEDECGFPADIGRGVVGECLLRGL